MELDRMKTRTGGVTVLRAGAAMALVAALAACGGGGDGDMGANQNTEMSGTPTLAERISAANAAAGALTDESDAAAVEAARNLIAAAQEAIGALPGTEQEAQDSQLVGAILLVERQEERVEDEEELAEAISMATTAVGNLTDESNEAEVMAARVLVTAAQDLGADEEALADSIADLEKQEGRVRTGKSIATALGNANDAANDLSDTSDADAVANARALIGTASTTGATEAQLASAEAAVAKHERRLDLATARAAISAAGTAVGAVKDNSEIGVVETAEGNIQTARKRVMDLEHLTADDRELLNGEIATIEGILTESKKDRDTAIAARNAEDAKERTADASALYARLVTATGSGVPSSSASVPAAVKAEHKGIETLYGEGENWLQAIGSSGAIGTKIGAEETSGPNAGYYPLAGADPHAVKASAFTQRVGQKHDTGASFAGSYMGVEGMFKCTADAGCISSPAPGEDMFTLPGEEWHFRPSDRMAKLQGAKVAEWGWWMDDSTATPSVAGAGPVKLRYASINSSGGDRSTGRTTFPAAGEATYSGAAHGQYAIVDGADSESGAFEATASLTARFRGNTDTELSGRVHDFDVNSGWEVMLKEGKAHDGSGVFEGKTVWKTGDEDGLGEGDWNASMYEGGTAEPTHSRHRTRRPCGSPGAGP